MTWNTVGVYGTVAIIATTAIGITPLLCYEHPEWPVGSDERSSVVRFPHVMCGDAEHQILVVLGVIALLMYTVAFLAVGAVANWRAPSMLLTRNRSSSQSKIFLATYRYMFARFRPECYYTGFLLLFRNSILTFLPAVSPDNGHMQVLVMQGIVLFYAFYTIRMQPWRVSLMNTCESGTMLILVMILNVVACYTSPAESVGLSVYAATLFGAGTLIPLCILIFCMFASLRKKPLTWSQHPGEVAALMKVWRAVVDELASKSDEDLNSALRTMPPYNFLELRSHLRFIVDHGLIGQTKKKKTIITKSPSFLTMVKHFSDTGSESGLVRMRESSRELPKSGSTITPVYPSLLSETSLSSIVETSHDLEELVRRISLTQRQPTVEEEEESAIVYL